MFNDDLAKRYEERGIPTEWRDITPDEMAPAYRLYWKGFKSPSGNLDGTDEFWRAIRDPDGESFGPPDDGEELLHNPVKALRKAGLISQEDPPPHISTFIVNHDKSLERFIVYAMVLVSQNPSTVGMTLVKEAE